MFAVSACVRVCACSFLYLLQYQLAESRGLFAIVVTLSLSSVYRRLLLLLLVSQPTHDETTARFNVGCAHRRGCCTHTGNGKAMQLLAHPLFFSLSATLALLTFALAKKLALLVSVGQVALRESPLSAE